MERRRAKNTKKTIVLTAACVIGAAALMLAVLLFLNRWQVVISLHGDADTAAKYGQDYEDPGAEARVYGTIFLRGGRSIPITAQGGVDGKKLGNYTITYRASYRSAETTVQRHIQVKDLTPPFIRLQHIPGHYTRPNAAYEEEGFTATDNCDGDVTDRVQRQERDGKVYYTVQDAAGNIGEMVRDIYYNDPVPPTITLQGESTIVMTPGSTFQEPGYSADDDCDGDLTGQVQVSGTVYPQEPGTYELTYTVQDAYGNTATATRTVVVCAPAQPSEKVIYLTFDDGPSQYTEKLLGILEKYQVKATFFVTNGGAYQSLIQKEAAAGHSVGIHTYSHNYDAIYASEDAYFSDLNAMQDVICTQTGSSTSLVRFPGGSSNTISCFNPGIMSRLATSLQEKGFQYFDWNVTSGDAGETTQTETVVQNVISGVQNYKTSIVLQHDTKGFSVDAVEQIIRWGLENGYTFLPLQAGSPSAHHAIAN